MPENNTLVTTAAFAAISFVAAVRSRAALMNERDARQRLAAEVSAYAFQNRALIEILDERGIKLTKEEASKLAAFPIK